MRKASNIYCSNYKFSSRTFKKGFLLFVIGTFLSACDLIKIKGGNGEGDEQRQPAARANNSYLYKDELIGIVASGTPPEDSAKLVEAYITSWIRKQLLIQEASRKIDINEAEVERKVLDYRFSIIAYEYQNFYVNKNLDTIVANSEIEQYYKDNVDNFILKQNIVQATFIKVPQNAPKTNKIKELIYSGDQKEENELKSYCLSFSAAYHISDSTWMVFDELVKNSPLAEIPNKIQFLKTNPYYETSDNNFLYFLKVDNYRISDNVSPLEFVRDDIRNIILNKRKVGLAKKLEDEVYNEAENDDDFEIYR
ncbi:MAG TPA: peptidyl-prolyl cis-trans isomerase [Chryseolinea sp.]|nr:peptidyl-prolyl cis-trans isomerase [Chryseolinea sp.]HZB13407.1 peptidyl-prolyl cis-trans isomerase [Chryseolinea sp.]